DMDAVMEGVSYAGTDSFNAAYMDGGSYGVTDADTVADIVAVFDGGSEVVMVADTGGDMDAGSEGGMDASTGDDMGSSDTPPTSGPAPTANPLRVEAETMELSGDYGTESVGVASDGKVISLIGGPSDQTGSAKMTFTGEDGTYDIKVAYFDENDGVGRLEVKQGDRTLSAFDLDQQLGSRFADNQTMTSQVIEDISIQAGDVFSFSGVEDGTPRTAEHARIDYVEFIPKSTSTPDADSNVAGVTLAIAKESAAGEIAGTSGDDVISIRTVAGNSTTTVAEAGEDKVILYGADQVPEGNYHEMLESLKQNPMKVAADYFGATHSVDLGSGNNDGADTLSIVSEIDALPKFMLKHTNADGRINGKGVAGENNQAFDHWAGVFGSISIANFDADNDKLKISGHTTALGESFTKDGDFFQTIYSEQNANNKTGPRAGAAHDDTFLGLLRFEDGAASADDIAEAIKVEGMKNYVVDGLGKEVYEGDPTSNQSGDSISPEPLLTFSLVNSDTDQVISDFENLVNGAEINLNGLDAEKYSVVAQVNPDHFYADLVESVKFESNLGNQTENVTPYALFGDREGDYRGQMPEPGKVEIKATAYSKNGGRGKAIESASLEYTIVETDASSPATEAMDLSALESYGGSGQDKSLDVALSNNNTTVRMEGNGWKKMGVNYTITPETMLSFEFRSDAKGEIHSIGFDNDNAISRADQQTSFQLFGEQEWGLQDFATYMAEAGWQSFEIPVGQYLEGEMAYLTLGNDQDIANPTAASEFRNIQLFEAPMGMGSASDELDPQALDGDMGMSKALETLTVAPSNL
ncbi:MAG: hypothetical protein ACFB8W_11415, partial [Elainellaceae cyanobacterium]